jgi:hypothetical protein
VTVVEGCDAGFEIERDEGGIDLQMTKGGIVDEYGGEVVEVMIDTSAGRTYEVLSELRHFVVEVGVKVFHIRKSRREFFFCLQQFRKLFIYLSQPDTY